MTKRIAIGLLACLLVIQVALGQGDGSLAVWENTTTNSPAEVTFGMEYTMRGDIRVQKIFTSNGKEFPSVFLPELPLKIYNDDPAFDLGMSDDPLRIIVLQTSDKKMAQKLEQAEGKYVEIAYRLTSINAELLAPVGLLVERVTILGDAKNSK